MVNSSVIVLCVKVNCGTVVVLLLLSLFVVFQSVAGGVAVIVMVLLFGVYVRIVFVIFVSLR